MTLLELQNIFAVHVSALILKAQQLGYTVSLGEAWRPEIMAEYYASHGQGIQHSLHTQRLAIDLNLFKGTEFLTTKTDYMVLGIWWESQSTAQYKLCWGGLFERPDSDHFSLSYAGEK